MFCLHVCVYTMSISDNNRYYMRRVRSPESRITDVCEPPDVLGIELRSFSAETGALTC